MGIITLEILIIPYLMGSVSYILSMVPATKVNGHEAANTAGDFNNMLMAPNIRVNLTRVKSTDRGEWFTRRDTYMKVSGWGIHSKELEHLNGKTEGVMLAGGETAPWRVKASIPTLTGCNIKACSKIIQNVAKVNIKR